MLASRGSAQTCLSMGWTASHTASMRIVAAALITGCALRCGLAGRTRTDRGCDTAQFDADVRRRWLIGLPAHGDKRWRQVNPAALPGFDDPAACKVRDDTVDKTV